MFGLASLPLGDVTRDQLERGVVAVEVDRDVDVVKRAAVDRILCVRGLVLFDDRLADRCPLLADSAQHVRQRLADEVGLFAVGELGHRRVRCEDRPVTGDLRDQVR